MSFVPDDVMQAVGAALGQGQQGDRAGARAAFQALWDQVGPGGDAFHRCAVAHSMADVQDDPHDELAWDLRALAALDELTDERVSAGGVAGPAAAFAPSLHLNLADVCHRLGDVDLARHHLGAGRASLGTMADDGYQTMIRDAFDRIDGALRARPTDPRDELEGKYRGRGPPTDRARRDDRLDDARRDQRR